MRSALVGRLLALVLISTLIALGIGNLIAWRWIEVQKRDLPSVDVVGFIERYSADLHHVRYPGNYMEYSADGPATLLLFNEVRPFNRSNRANILLQGDSWAEKAGYGAGRIFMDSVATSRSYGIVAAGVSSYAPTPMTMQLRILRRDFGLHPGVVIAIVDQTDIGDELCRYRSFRALDAYGALVRVNALVGTDEKYDMSRYVTRARTIYSSSLAITKLVKLARNASPPASSVSPHCGWGEIARPLASGVSAADAQYFVGVIRQYIDEVFSDSAATQLVFVTHPHRNHLSPPGDPNHYVLNVSTLVASAIVASSHRDRITLRNVGDAFSSVYAGRPTEDIFEPGDLASHLTDRSIATAYLPYIFSTRF